MAESNPRLLRTVYSEDRIQIFREGQADAIITQHAEQNKRPFIHPVVAPDGKGILTENAPPHHPWQHGIYVGLNDVNGIGFWEEGVRNNPQDGTFHPRALQQPVTEGNQVEWIVVSDWRAPDGTLLLVETQQWTFHDLGATYELDLDWTLTAAVDLTFGKYEYGGLFLRMPFRYDRGGQALSSTGLLNEENEGQRARWVAVSMIVDGREDEAGIAYMDHPANPEHPVPWRVDGQLGIAPSRCILGPWKLAKEQSQSYNHRVLIFSGTTDVAQVEASWSRFSNNGNNG